MTRIAREHLGTWIVSAALLAGLAVSSSLDSTTPGGDDASLAAGIQAAHTAVSSYQDPEGKYVIYRRVPVTPGS